MKQVEIYRLIGDDQVKTLTCQTNEAGGIDFIGDDEVLITDFKRNGITDYTNGQHGVVKIDNPERFLEQLRLNFMNTHLFATDVTVV